MHDVTTLFGKHDPLTVSEQLSSGQHALGHGAGSKMQRNRASLAKWLATPAQDGGIGSAGTLLNYRFMSWHGQPSVSIRLDEDNKAYSVRAISESQRIEAALQEHAGSLASDVHLQFEGGCGDDARSQSGASSNDDEAEEE
jgi:hypothetical protein